MQKRYYCRGTMIKRYKLRENHQTRNTSKVLKKWKHKGRQCVIIGMSFSREKYIFHHFCGYVGTNMFFDYKYLNDIGVYGNVHGGITFSGKLNMFDIKGKFYGFDCAHAGDWCPTFDGKIRILNDNNLHKWTLEEVKKECENFAEWIIRLEKRKLN